MSALTVQLVIMVAKSERHLRKYFVEKKNVHFGQAGPSIVIAVLLVAMVLRKEHANVLALQLVKMIVMLERQSSKNHAEKQNAQIGLRIILIG